MVMPSGRRSSDPAPPCRIRGTAPSSAAMVVIMIGRKRSRQACSIAWAAVRRPECCASIAKSIIMIAFFFTMPISSTTPTRATIERSLPVTISASSAPMPADGKVERIVTGWMMLS